MSEFELTTFSKGEIKFDLEDAKKRISERTEPYTKMVVTEDTIKDAKDVRASLNKEKTALDTERKEIAKEFKKPLTEFESKVKEVLAFYDEAIGNIDKQVKAFDEERVKEKQKHLHELYDTNIGEYSEFLPFDKVKRPQWDNVTYKDIDIIHDISCDKTKVMSDLDVLKALDSEIYDKLIEKYKASGNDLAQAIKANQDYIQAKQLAEKKAEEEAQAKIEAERKAREEAEQKAAEATKRAEEAEKKAEEPFNEEPKKDYAVFTVRVKNEEQAQQVRQFCEFSDIQYSVIF